MSRLTDSQLVQLDNLIYYISNDKTVEKRLTNGSKISVGDIVNISLQCLNDFNGNLPAAMDASEWEVLLISIQNDTELCKYEIQGYTNDPWKSEGDEGENTYNFCAATFVNPDDRSDLSVVFRGTNSDSVEWTDNGAGGYLEKTPYQERAAAYVQDIYDNNGNRPITVSGHSKGGNLAMYTAIMTDCVDRCVAVDGQGFSEEFIRENVARIGLKRNNITLISAANDYVNPILYTVAEDVKYVDTNFELNPFMFHKPNILLNDSGELNRYTDASGIRTFVNLFTTYVNSCVDDPLRQQTIDRLTSLLGAETPVLEKIGNAFVGLGTLLIMFPDFFDWLEQFAKAKIEQIDFLDDHEFENEEAIKQYLLEHTGQEYPKYLVRGALLHCRYGSHARRLNLLKDHGVYTQNCPLIHELNCETAGERNISWFGVCQSPCPPTTETLHLKGDAPRAADGSELGEASGVVHGHKCEPFIISFKRLDSYPINRIVDNGDIDPKEEGLASVTTLSYLVCNWGGLIEPYNSGQEYGDSGEARDDT